MAHRVRIDASAKAAGVRDWDPESALDKALKEREAFLAAHPRMRRYQREIDRVLENSGSPENRLSVLCIMIEGKLQELRQQLRNLYNILMPILSQP